MPHKSPYPDVDIPDTDLWKFLFERSELPYLPTKTLYRDAFSSRSYTYRALRQTSIAFGQALIHSWNWQKGDVLAIYSPNDVDYPAVTFGCHWAGGVVTTVNPGYTEEELTGQLRDSRVRSIVTQAHLLETAWSAARSVGIPLDRVILMGPETRSQATLFTNLPARPVSRPPEISPDEDLSFLVYSSGTTGKPKGVMLSHRNIVANILQIEATNYGHLSCGDGDSGSGDRTIGFLPLYHIFGLTTLISVCTFAGYEVFVMPQFELQKFCELVQSERISFCFVVPRIILALSKEPVVDNYNLSSLRMLISAAAPLTKELVVDMYNRLRIPVKQSFGTSETSPGVHSQQWDAWDKPIGSIGVPDPNILVKIVRIEDQSEADPGEAGEMWIRGPNVFKGYLNNIAATEASLTADGWYKSGDVGYVDKNGCFFITDRIKELIKYNGFQVAPAELEGLLVSHPQVQDAAVIGIFSEERQTELPRAYVVPKPSVQADQKTANEITSWLNSRVSNHKKLRGGLRLIDAIPVSPSGKILRRELRVRAEAENVPGGVRAKL